MQKIFKESDIDDEKSAETMAIPPQEVQSGTKNSASISAIMQHKTCKRTVPNVQCKTDHHRRM